MRRLTPLGALTSTVLTVSVSAQEIVEIDLEAGRTIIDDQYRSLYGGRVAVDWTRGLLYGDDQEEPDGFMVFSLITGEWIRTVFAPRGEGPGELTNGKTGLALAPNGGLYVSGYLRILEFDSLGTRTNTWTPVRPATMGVCDFGGEPAVPTQGGVVRRGPEYQDQNIGPVATAQLGSEITGPRQEAIATGLALLSDTRIACSEDAAYVFTAIDNEPGTLTVYERDGTVGNLTVPPEDAKEGGCSIKEIRNGQQVIQRGGSCQHWSRRAQVSFDGHGNLVLLGAGALTHGAIINPETGCYALIRTRQRLLKRPVGIHSDSVLVYHLYYEETVRPDGRIHRNVRPNSAPKVTINPIRRVSGEPCDGILRGVRRGEVVSPSRGMIRPHPSSSRIHASIARW